MASISAPDLTLLRTGKFTCTPYLSVLQPTTLLSALVNNGSIARGDRSIAFDTGTGTAGNFALIEPGQTLAVVTADGTKKVRVKSITGNESTGTITVDENAIDWANNQVITILHEYRFWPIPPRITGGQFYKLYDLAYSGQNLQPPPVALAGPHRAGFLSAGSLVFNISAIGSYAVASGATISSYAWSCNGGTIASASSATTTITFTTAGQYWLKLTVTDSNGKTQSTFRALFVYDADNMPYTNFDVNSVSGSWQSGGWRAAFSVNGDVELDDFPDGALVLLWHAGKINGAADYVNLWGAGDNVLFSGYIRTDNDTDDYTTGAGTVEFSAVSPEGMLDEITEFGTVSITAVATPTTWYEYASWLTVGRAVHHLLRWHSTAFSCVDILGLTGNTLGMKAANFTEPSLLQQVNSLGFNRGHFAKLVSDRTGRLHFATDTQYLNDAGRAALDTVFSITNADISGAINVTRQPEGRVGYCDLDGFSFDGTTSTPLISLAPGYIDSISISMAEFTGTGGLPIKNQVLSNQTDSNEKAGRALAVANNPINEIRLDMPTNYSGAFDIVPSIGWYDWGIANSSLKRNLPLFGKNLVCRSVENRIDVKAGTIQTSVILEPEVFGADGIPGNYPTTYPVQTKNPPAPVWNEPAPESSQVLVWSDDSDYHLYAAAVDSNPVAINATNTMVNAACYYPRVISLTSSLIVIGYVNAISYGTALAATVAGTTITPDTPVSAETGVAFDPCLCKLTDSTFLLVYAKFTVGVRGVVGTVTGTTVTFGSPINISDLTNCGLFSATALTPTKAIITFRDASDDNTGKVLVVDISGDTITPGTVQDFQAGDATDYVARSSIIRMSDSQAVVAYEFINGTAGTIDANARVLDVSGTTVTVGDSATGISESSFVTGEQISAYPINSTTFVILKSLQVGSNNQVQAVAGSISVATITFGSAITPVENVGDTGVSGRIIVVSSALALYGYRAYIAGDHYEVFAGSLAISGTTLTDNGDETTASPAFGADWLDMAIVES